MMVILARKENTGKDGKLVSALEKRVYGFNDWEGVPRCV
jgi:hypothetical protein